jgi:integrase
MDSMCKE